MRTLRTLRTMRTMRTLSTLPHTRATCSAVGSAQQYQGSFRYGTDVRGITESGDLLI